MSTVQAFIALNRFGFGARPGELAAVSRDPRGWLSSQIDVGHGNVAALRGEPDTMTSLAASRDALALGRKNRMAMRKEIGQEALMEKRKEGMKQLQKELIDDIFLRTKIAVDSQTPFLERLVHFWSNHFTVSAVAKREIAGVCGAFERDVIRSHILGRFEDMVMASSKHPAMLFYLDNAQSIGPNAPANRRGKRGLNENLAREILELHTLGVDGGYTQADVREFARMLTGWTIDLEGQGDGSGFIFMPILHEPGPKTLLGKTYQGGVQEAEQVIRDVSRHKSTARFIATKLARHFIADDPPQAAIDKLAATFYRSRGDLKQVTQTLIALPEVWREPLPKVKTPNDLIISSLRSVGAPLEKDKKSVRRIAGAYKLFNQVPFSAPSPAGWADEAYAWISSEAMMRRVTLAQMIAALLRNEVTADALLEQTIGPVAADSTRQAVARAPSPVDALALLYASPEFQRR